MKVNDNKRRRQQQQLQHSLVTSTLVILSMTTTPMMMMIVSMMTKTGCTRTMASERNTTVWMDRCRNHSSTGHSDLGPFIRRQPRSTDDLASAAPASVVGAHLVHPDSPPRVKMPGQSTHQLDRNIQNDVISGGSKGTGVRLNASSSSSSAAASAAAFHHHLDQHPHSVSFRTPGAYLVTRFKLYSTFSIQFQIRTVQSNGLIVFCGNIGSGKDFMALELVNGRINYIFDLGAGARTVSAGHDPTAPLNDDLWHRVSVVRSTLSEHVIRVDDDVTADHLLDGRSLFFDTGEELYIGGVPEYAYNTLPKQIRSRDGFRGCLADVQLDRRSVSLLEHPIGIPKTHRKHITSGCENPADGQQDEGNGKQCSEKSCDNSGVCFQQTGGYVCNCDMTSYTGPTCKDDSIAYKFGRHGGVVSFTFAEGEWPDTKRDEICLGFRTFQPDAVLLFISSTSSNDFIEMELVDGNVVVIYNMGLMQHPIGELFERFDDGRYHVVRFTRDGPNSTIQVDRLPVQPKYPTEFYQRKSESDDSGQQLTTFNNQQKIVTGGKKDDSGNLVRPFHGTISGLVVNGLRILDLASERDERVTIQGDVELEVKVMRPSHQPKTFDRFEARTYVAPLSTMEWKKALMHSTVSRAMSSLTDDLVIVAGSTLTADQSDPPRRPDCPFDECPLIVHPSSTDSFIRPIITRRSTTTKSPEVTSSMTPSTPTPRRRIADHVIRYSSGEDLSVPCLYDDEDCDETGSTGDPRGNQREGGSIRPRSPPYHVAPTDAPRDHTRIAHPPSGKPRSRPHPPPTPTAAMTVASSPTIPSTSTLPDGHSTSDDPMESGRDAEDVDEGEVLAEETVDQAPPSGGLTPGRSLTMNIALIAGIGAGVVVLIIVLAYALYKFNSRKEGTRKMGQLSQLGEYDDLHAVGHSILGPSSKGEATDPGTTADAAGNSFGSAKRKKKDVKEWYV